MLTDSHHRSSSSTRLRNRRHPSGTNHILQLFDTRESLARSVASFLLAGLNQGQMLLVVVIPTHWRAVASELRAFGADPEALQRTGSLTVRDAEAALAAFMRQGKPRRAPFAQTVGNEVVRLASAAPRGLRIYGEMVELLAQEGNYSGAAELERLWNTLTSRCAVTLLCGYSAAHFAAPDAGSALEEIRCAHSESISRHSDPLGRFLLASEEERRAAADRLTRPHRDTLPVGIRRFSPKSAAG